MRGAEIGGMLLPGDADKGARGRLYRTRRSYAATPTFLCTDSCLLMCAYSNVRFFLGGGGLSISRFHFLFLLKSCAYVHFHPDAGTDEGVWRLQIFARTLLKRSQKLALITRLA